MGKPASTATMCQGRTDSVERCRSILVVIAALLVIPAGIFEVIISLIYLEVYETVITVLHCVGGILSIISGVIFCWARRTCSTDRSRGVLLLKGLLLVASAVEVTALCFLVLDMLVLPHVSYLHFLTGHSQAFRSFRSQFVSPRDARQHYQLDTEGFIFLVSANVVIVCLCLMLTFHSIYFGVTIKKTPKAPLDEQISCHWSYRPATAPPSVESFENSHRTFSSGLNGSLSILRSSDDDRDDHHIVLHGFRSLSPDIVDGPEYCRFTQGELNENYLLHYNNGELLHEAHELSEPETRTLGMRNTFGTKVATIRAPVYVPQPVIPQDPKLCPYRSAPDLSTYDDAPSAPPVLDFSTFRSGPR